MNIDLRTADGWRQLKAALDGRTDEVLRKLGLPTPRKAGWTQLDDPRGNGRNCFGICIRGDGLAWKQFNGDARGRLLELIAYCNGWYHLKNRGSEEAARWALQHLGLGNVSRAQLARDAEQSAKRAEKARAEEAEVLRRKQGRAFYTFSREAVDIVGTGGEVYLREARGIDLAKDPFIGPRGGRIWPRSLRFVASHKYVHRDKSGRKYAESYHPAIIACCVDADMQIRAIHQTYLADDFSDKVKLQPAPDGFEQKPRKVWPDSAGLVLPLWRGEGQYSPKEAAAIGLVQTLVLTEGVEDGLTAVLAAPQFRTWGMISLSNMVNVAARLPECCDSVIVHRQNDWDKPEAVASFDRGIAAIRATGRPTEELAAVYGKDINDTLRGAA